MSLSVRASLDVAFVLASSTHAQTLVRSVNGPPAGAQFGKACIAIPDQNGDGFEDLLVGAPAFNGARGAVLATGAGAQTLWSLAPFTIDGLNFVNQRSGLLFYGHQTTATPFQGGTKCVLDPVARTAVQSSGGATSGASCTGLYSFDFNDWIHSGGDGSLTAGAQVFAQYWSRDPQSPSHTGLSNAVQFVINP